MDPTVTEWLNAIFRWFHVVAGILWIGHLYFFNFVNAHVAKTYDADSKKKVVPELMPRALFWFRWGAMFTWVTGILLLGILYYMHSEGAASIMEPNTPGMKSIGAGALTGVSLGLVLIPFFLYDALWKSPAAKNEMVGVGISFALVAGVAFGLSQIMSGRSVFIHMGVLFGSIMFMNVWMRIWPAQRKIIAGIKGTGPAVDAALPAMAGLRSKHNTYMSVPLVFFMVSNHFGTIIGGSALGPTLAWVVAVGFIAVGFGLTKVLYLRSATPGAAAF